MKARSSKPFGASSWTRKGSCTTSRLGPGNYLLETVLARKKGNCLGLSMLYLSLADRLGLPFRGVYVPSHCFVRYEGETVRRNVEFAEGGAIWKDERYRREFRIRPGRPYLLSLGSLEMVGVFLKTSERGIPGKGRRRMHSGCTTRRTPLPGIARRVL